MHSCVVNVASTALDRLSETAITMSEKVSACNREGNQSALKVRAEKEPGVLTPRAQTFSLIHPIAWRAYFLAPRIASFAALATRNFRTFFLGMVISCPAFSPKRMIIVRLGR